MAKKMSELRAMDDDELYFLSLKKGRNGNASWEAKQAQKLLWERASKPYSYNKVGTVNVGEGNSTTKQFSYPDSKF